MESALKLQTMIACPLRFSLRLLSQGCLISALLCASNPRRLSSAQQKQFRKCFINKFPKTQNFEPSNGSEFILQSVK